MKKQNISTTHSTALRQKAEKWLQKKEVTISPLLSEAEALKLIHELQLYQVELEMQYTELERAKEQTANEAAQKYADLYDFAPSGFFSLSRDGKIKKLNLVGAVMLGKDRSRLTDNLFSIYVSDDTKPVFSHFLSQVFSHEVKESCEITLQIKNKEPVYVHLVGVVSVNFDECLVTATDITSRIHAEEVMKQNEAALTHQNELFSHLLENLQIGVFMVEAPSGKPLLANEKALTLLGRGILPDANKYNLAEVYKAFKAGSRQPYPPEEMPILLGINGKSAHVDDMIVVRPDGTEIPIEIYGTPVKDINGNVWASLVSFMDITERKKAEAEIKSKNDELLKTNFEKDKFFSIIAHDLRSPFNSFLGLTMMMEEELPTLSRDEIQSFAASMRKSANMLFHLLENLLEWSRMQRGLNSFKPDVFILSEAVADSIILVQDAADKKKIEIRQHIPVNMVVEADRTMFESLMRNLIFNAVKFTPVRGEITIAAKKIPGGFVEISVSDTGIGMEKSMIDKIFRLDEQTHRKGTEGEPSTGLGLILCKEFAEKHGGRIWAESEENNGSTFYFTIPFKADMEEKSINNTYVATEEAANQVKNLTILIVEDDEISEMLIQMAFKTYASKVISVHTGLEAVETCRNNPDLDLVMMDIQTPDIDGYEATRLIRKFNKEIVIIAQTAFASAEDYTNAINAGCNDYISKPISIKALKRLIEKHFNPPQTEIGDAK